MRPSLPSSISCLISVDGRHAAVVVPDHVRHAGRFDRRDHRLALPPRSGRAASRTSPSCRPSRRRWRSRACVSFGLAMSMRSMSLRSTSVAPVGLDRLVAPVRRRTPSTRSALRAHDRLEHRLIRQVEEPRRLAERVRVRPAHEAVADEPDVQCFHRMRSQLRRIWRRSSHPQSQPCASRHRDHRAPSTSFQVCWLRHHRVREHAAVPADVLERAASASPLLVAQPEAGVRTMSSLPLGSVGRQCRPVLSCEPEPLTVASFCATWKSIVHGRSASVIVLQRRRRAPPVRPVEVLGQDAILGRVVAHA